MSRSVSTIQTNNKRISVENKASHDKGSLVRSSTFDYTKTSPLRCFNPPAPYQYFTQLNTVHPSQGKNTAQLLDPLQSPSQSPSQQRTPKQQRDHQKSRQQKYTNTKQANFLDGDKRQIVQCLSDYVRVFCGVFKSRFLLSDIEELFTTPVIIKSERLDPYYAQRRELFTCFSNYFKSGKVRPLQWFDILTAWKDGHHRVLTYEEFHAGFQDYCEEMSFLTWEIADLKEIYRYMARGDENVVRRQDFRFAMRRNALTKRKINWINRQGCIFKKINHFLKKIRAKFADFSPSSVIRKKGKTITMNELESMLFLVFTDYVIFTNCRNIDQLLGKKNKAQLYRADSTSSSTTAITYDSLDSLSVASYGDQGSVGSLLSRAEDENVHSHGTVSPSQRCEHEYKQDEHTSLASSLKGTLNSPHVPTLSLSPFHNNVPKPAGAVANALRSSELSARTEDSQLRPDEIQYLEDLVSRIGIKPSNSLLMLPQPRRTSISSPATVARRSGIEKRHSIIQQYAAIRSSRLAGSVSKTGDSAGEERKESQYDLKNVLPFSFGIPCTSMPGLDESLTTVNGGGSVVNADELAAFEALLEDRNVKNMKSFQTITDHFDRRVNLARVCLSKLHSS
jgi:hypothetical protein